MWRVSGYSSIGSLHIKKNLPNQDAFLISDRVIPVMAISDGHGSQSHLLSDRGSFIAVSCAISCVEKLFDSGRKLQNAEDYNKLVNMGIDVAEALKTVFSRELVKKVVCEWRNSVIMDFEDIKKSDLLKVVGLELNVNQELNREYSHEDIYKLYGCTLIVVFLYEGYIFFMQIGDGLATVYELGGKIVHPLSGDIRHKNNATTSLSDSQPELNFKFGIYEITELTQYVMLTTDGIENAYPRVNAYSSFFHDAYWAIEENRLEELIDKHSLYSGDDATCTLICLNKMDCNKMEIHEKIIYSGACESLIPFSNLLSDKSSVGFLDIAEALCLELQVMEEKGLELARIELQDLFYDNDDDCIVIISTFLIPKNIESSSNFKHELWRILYAIFYKEYPEKDFIFLSSDDEIDCYYKNIELSIDSKDYRKGLRCFMEKGSDNRTLREWIEIIGEIRRSLSFDYERGCFVLDVQPFKQLKMLSQNSELPIFKDSLIFRHHILNMKNPKPSIVGKIVIHPKNKKIWGVKNCSGHEWIQYLKGKNDPIYIPTGKVATLIAGSVIFVYGLPIRIEYTI